MKAFISYVIQRGKEHSHHSETIEIQSPPYNYSWHIDSTNILNWANDRKKDLIDGEELVIINFFKV